MCQEVPGRAGLTSFTRDVVRSPFGVHGLRVGSGGSAHVVQHALLGVRSAHKVGVADLGFHAVRSCDLLLRVGVSERVERLDRSSGGESAIERGEDMDNVVP